MTPVPEMLCTVITAPRPSVGDPIGRLEQKEGRREKLSVLFVPAGFPRDVDVS